MAITIQPVLGVVVGSYGQGITITIVNEDGVAQDVSGYTTITIVGLSPDERTTKTATADYATANNGTDGKISFSWADGDIKRSGTWKIQAEFSKVGEVFKTYYGEMDVGQGLR